MKKVVFHVFHNQILEFKFSHLVLPFLFFFHAFSSLSVIFHASVEEKK